MDKFINRYIGYMSTKNQIGFELFSHTAHCGVDLCMEKMTTFVTVGNKMINGKILGSI